MLTAPLLSKTEGQVWALLLVIAGARLFSRLGEYCSGVRTLIKLKLGPVLRDSGWQHNGFRILSLLNRTVLELFKP